MPDDILIPELKRAIDEQKTTRRSSNDVKLEMLRDKPFWIWDKDEHKTAFVSTNGACCFNHIVGLPVKNGKSRPLFPYQKKIYDLTMDKIELAKLSDKELKEKFGDLTKRLGVWIEKATGMGISEFYLRFMGWLCTRDDYYKNSQFCIVTGPRIDLATGLVDRLKGIFIDVLNFKFDDAAHVLQLNGTHIEAYPSHNLSSMRGLPNVRFILLDEADFFPIGEQQNARAISERYLAKSSPVLVMVSTPNADEPDGLYAKMKLEFDEAEKKGTLDQLIYTPIELPYTEGLGTMFTESEIASAKLSHAFETEYNLQRGYGLGNLLLPESIDKMIKLGDSYGDDKVDVNNTYIGPVDTFELVTDINNMFSRKDVKYDKMLFVPTIGSTRIMGIDGAFGSSKFAIVVVELVYTDNKPMLRVLYADEFERIDYSSALERCENLVKFYNVKRVYIDGANPEVVGGIRKLFGEVHDYHLDRRPDKSWAGYPVNFNTEGRPLLAKLQRIITMGHLAAHPYFNDLIIQLRIAKHKAYDLEKRGSVQLDMLDALRLATKHFAFT